jgi:hypothetical protein
MTPSSYWPRASETTRSSYWIPNPEGYIMTWVEPGQANGVWGVTRTHLRTIRRPGCLAPRPDSTGTPSGHAKMPPIPGTDLIPTPSEEVRIGAVRAVVVDPEAPGRFTIREVEATVPVPNEALVQVAAISLNAGELRRALAPRQAGDRAGICPGR